MSEPVELTIVQSEMEAAELCGFLAQHGIEATYERGSLDQGFWSLGNPAPGAAGVGPQAIWVQPQDADHARKLLASLPS
jgi:hypothetical protein